MHGQLKEWIENLISYVRMTTQFRLIVQPENWQRSSGEAWEYGVQTNLVIPLNMIKNWQGGCNLTTSSTVTSPPIPLPPHTFLRLAAHPTRGVSGGRCSPEKLKLEFFNFSEQIDLLNFKGATWDSKSSIDVICFDKLR